MPGPSIWSRYSFAWVTLVLFLIAISGHWFFGWLAYLEEVQAVGAKPTFHAYFVTMMRDTLENWQSDFLQLIWNVAGLAFLLHVGSSQSKEGMDRMEAKVDLILRRLDPGEGAELLAQVDAEYGRKVRDAPRKL